MLVAERVVVIASYYRSADPPESCYDVDFTRDSCCSANARILVDYKPDIGEHLAGHWKALGRILVGYDWILVEYGQILVDFWPVTGRLWPDIGGQ